MVVKNTYDSLSVRIPWIISISAVLTKAAMASTHIRQAKWVMAMAGDK
jgi:hypothetical protein